MLPLLGALDANHDGVIDADEIKNASAVLLKLDKNGDGKLTRDEFIGRPPGRQDGPPPGGPSDRPDGRKDARFDDSGPPRDGRDFGPPGGGREFGDRGPGQRGPAPSADAILEKFDTNKDGKLDKTELAVFLKDLQSRRPPPLAGGPRPGGPPREDGPPR
jgi:hypothetical protein